MPALNAIYTIWLREFLVFWREKSRIVGMIAQPLIYLLILGKGINSAMSMRGATAGIDYLRFMYPGVLGMSALFTSIFSALSIIWDREFGFLKEVLVAPVPRWAVAVGKILGGATVAVLQCAILILAAPLVGIALTPLVVLELLLLAFFMSFTLTGLGVLVAARMESMQGFQMVMNFLVVPLYFLSGAMFPLHSAPRALKAFMLLDPLTYGVDALRSAAFSRTFVTLGPGVRASLAQVGRQAGLIRWSLGHDLLAMGAVAVLFTAAGAWQFSRS